MTDLLARNTDDNGITTLTLNQPERRNSLSMGMLDALAEALADIATDDATRVVVIAAAGKVFAPGTISRRFAVSLIARSSNWRCLTDAAK